MLVCSEVKHKSYPHQLNNTSSSTIDHHSNDRGAHPDERKAAMGNSTSLPEIQSFDVEGVPKTDGEGVPRVLAKNIVLLPTMSKIGTEVDNIYGMFARSVGLYPDNPCMGKRPGTGPDGVAHPPRPTSLRCAERSVSADPSLSHVPLAGAFEWMTYAECMEKIKAIGSGLAGIGIEPRDSFGIFAANSMQWAWAGLGGWQVGATLVSVYDTLGDIVVMYEVNHADMKMIFVEKEKLGGVLSVLMD
eukprot:6237654-Prymnesium_polylepis.1